MIYQIVITVLLIYTILISAIGTFIVYMIEVENNNWYKSIGLSKEETIRKTSITVNTHFILMLVCIGVLIYGEYNVF